MRTDSLCYIRRTGRVVLPFPWITSSPCPWPQATHQRVLIPLTEDEKRNSKKKVHVQIMRKDNLQYSNPPRIRIRSQVK